MRAVSLYSPAIGHAAERSTSFLCDQAASKERPGGAEAASTTSCVCASRSAWSVGPARSAPSPFSRDEGDDRFVLARWKLLNQGAGNCGCGRKVRAKSAVGIFELFELAAVGQQHDEPASNEYFTLHTHTTSSVRSPVDPAVAPAAPGPQSASRPVGWLLPVNEPRSSGERAASAPVLE